MTHPDNSDKPPIAPTQLFRHSLRDGRVHPLLHLVQRYRQEPKR